MRGGCSRAIDWREGLGSGRGGETRAPPREPLPPRRFVSPRRTKEDAHAVGSRKRRCRHDPDVVIGKGIGRAGDRRNRASAYASINADIMMVSGRSAIAQSQMGTALVVPKPSRTTFSAHRACVLVSIARVGAAAVRDVVVWWTSHHSRQRRTQASASAIVASSAILSSRSVPGRGRDPPQGSFFRRWPVPAPRWEASSSSATAICRERTPSSMRSARGRCSVYERRRAAARVSSGNRYRDRPRSDSRMRPRARDRGSRKRCPFVQRPAECDRDPARAAGSSASRRGKR